MLRDIQEEQELEGFVLDFLEKHPEVKQMLELFGISNDQYRQYLAAQRGPVYYTTTSTVEGDSDGELD